MTMIKKCETCGGEMELTEKESAFVICKDCAGKIEDPILDVIMSGKF